MPFSNTTACSQVSLSSSTTSTRISSISAAVFLSTLLTPKGRSTINVVPAPSWLSTSIVPSMIATRFLVIAIPKPVPPYFLAIPLSACSNGSYKCSKNSFFIPMPLSFTINLSHILSLAERSILISSLTLPPLGVNLIALDNKLSRIWLTRIESPSNSSSLNPEITISKDKPLAVASP